MAVVFSLFARTNKIRDWTNDELAELYRVEHALGQANIALEVERGVTDEGDPWFVFCRRDGEVLIHVARYDGHYHLFSPTLPKPLVGKSFSELTQSFIAKVPAKDDASPSSNVVRHPSALLSMLVVTIFFSIDYLTGHGGRADAAPLALARSPAPESGGAIQAVVANMLASVGNTEAENVLESAFLAAQAAVLYIGSGAALYELAPLTAVAAPVEMAVPAVAVSASSQTVAPTAPDNPLAHAVFPAEVDPALALAAPGGGATGGSASMATAGLTAPAPMTAAPVLAAMTAPAPAAEILPAGTATHSAFASAGEMVVLASPSGGEVNLAGDGSIHVIELLGNGSVTLSGLSGDGSQAIEMLGGAETLKLEFGSGANSLKQTVEIKGGSAVTLQSVSTQGAAAGATVNLTIDSTGSHPNALTVSDAAVQSATLNLKIVGSQDLTLQESAKVLNGSSLDASGLHAQLTVGVDLSGLAGPTTLVGSSDFVVNNNDIVALVNVPDNVAIQVATNLDSVLTQFAHASSSQSMTLDLQSAGQTADPISVGLVNVNGAASLNLNAGGGVSIGNNIGVLLDSNLQNIQVHGSGSLSIGAIDGVTSANSQNITIDASQLGGNLSIDVSGVPDVANGGRQITIIGGQGNNVLTNTNATEATTFVAGGGKDTFNIASGAQSVTVNGLHAGDAIVVGGGAKSDVVVDATHLPGLSGTYLDSMSLQQAASAAASAEGVNGAHQAVLFDYHNSLYVFIDVAGSHVFNASVDALVQIVGMSKAVDLAHVFFSA